MQLCLFNVIIRFIKDRELLLKVMRFSVRLGNVVMSREDFKRPELLGDGSWLGFNLRHEDVATVGAQESILIN